MRCPNCGSYDTYVFNESATTGSEFNVCNGILGYICLGPIGLLCVLTGKKQTYTRNYIVCNNCHIKSRV